ncbi:collagen-like triple helix repeat-containing protein [Aquimarina algiphila]|uniref:collagen-like triple helix repeat-containing protein n=1 Tax=Aquimarina algiphila TaxID=2047982 RepID=UPI00232FD6CD|nr:collagen-like protein [Aquimarina algiphila]
MKAKKKLVRLLMVLMVSASIFSCSDGEDGAIGPAGPAGVDGTDGVDGQDGTPGTANVIFSDWIQQGFGDEPIEQANESFDIEASEITQKVLDQGVVLIFGRNLTTVAEEVIVTVYQLPYTFSFNSGNKQIEFRHSITPPTGNKAIGVIKIRARELNGNDLEDDVTLLDEYRYVIIPGGAPVAPSSSGKSSNVDYSKMSYEEIKAQFNISE